MARKIDKVLATDATVGAAAVLIVWAADQWAPVGIGMIEAGAFIVLAQSLAHKAADWWANDDA